MPTDLWRRLVDRASDHFGRGLGGPLFRAWLNGFEIYYETLVLVELVSKGTAAEKVGG